MQIALDDSFKANERVVVRVQVNGDEYVLCTLIAGKCDQYALGGGVVFNARHPGRRRPPG